jgi:PST family polysaccharide transporter
MTFGNDDHAWAIALLSLAVLFQILAGGQGALIQGTRRIGDLARMGVIGALLGTLVGIPIAWLLREQGVAPSLVCMAAMSLLVSWRYSRKVLVDPPSMTFSEVRGEAAELLKFGLALMASGFLMIGVSYAVRMMLARQIGLEAAGLYAAAWTLGGLYVNFIVQAMGVDFCPRLVEVAANDAQCNRLTDEQSQINMLLAAPGVCATIVCAPLVIALFYTSEFVGAIETLRWICLGVAIRMITWPMGFIIVAKGRRRLFLAVDFAWAAVNVVLTWLFVGWFGLNGAGLAFFGSYLFYGLILYPVVLRLTGFSWSRESRHIGLLSLLCIGSVFAGCRFLPSPWADVAGIGMTIVSGMYSLHRLLTSLAEDRLPPKVRRILEWLRISHWYPA